MDSTGQAELEDIIDELKRFNRRFESLEGQIESLHQTLNLLYKDRSILEDIEVAVKSFGNTLQYHRQSQTNLSQDIQADISQLAKSVHSTPEKVEDLVQIKLDHLTDTIKSNGKVLIKSGFWGNIKLLLVKPTKVAGAVKEEVS